MSAQDIWLRKHHELWEKLEDNTKTSFCTALWKWLISKTKHAMQVVALQHVLEKVLSPVHACRLGVR